MLILIFSKLDWMDLRYIEASWILVDCGERVGTTWTMWMLKAGKEP